MTPRSSRPNRMPKPHASQRTNATCSGRVFFPRCLAMDRGGNPSKCACASFSAKSNTSHIEKAGQNPSCSSARPSMSRHPTSNGSDFSFSANVTYVAQPLGRGDSSIAAFRSRAKRTTRSTPARSSDVVCLRVSFAALSRAFVANDNIAKGATPSCASSSQAGGMPLCVAIRRATARQSDGALSCCCRQLSNVTRAAFAGVSFVSNRAPFQVRPS